MSLTVGGQEEVVKSIGFPPVVVGSNCFDSQFRDFSQILENVIIDFSMSKR